MKSLLGKLSTFLATCAVFAGAVWIACWAVRPDLRTRAFHYTPQQLAEAAKIRDVSFDPKHPPDLYVHETVKARGESPLLKQLVEQGKLPPLADRVPADPTVMEGPDGTGKYGGTWMRLALSAGDVAIINYRLSGAFLVRWSPLGYPIEPHIAKAVVPSADKKIWDVYLRPGLKWSDGEPYTADDIMYWWNDEANCPLIATAAPPFMRQGNTVGKIEKVDLYHVRFVFDEPYATFLEQLTAARDLCDTPEHYLKQFHPDPTIGNMDLVRRTMAAYKQPSALATYRYMKLYDNPDYPHLWPWIYRRYKTDPPQVFVRNPYYYVVDKEGNQLPYIDRIQFDVQDPKILVMTAANGGVSMQDRGIPYDDYTELMSRRDAAGTDIYHWYGASRSTYAINPDLNRRIDPNDPSTVWKAKLLGDKRFRQALSLAINRKAIIKAEYNDQTEPSQVAPGPLSPFANEKVFNAFIQYDPKRAGEMLDELGLNKWDHEGYREFPDGTRMSFNFDVTEFTGPGPAQFVIDDWAAVGVRAVLRERSRSLFYADKDGMNFDFNVWTSESDYMPLLSPRYFIPNNTEAFYAVGWARWYMRGGFYGSPDANIHGAIPVPKDSPMYEAITCYEKALRATSFDEQKKLMDRVLDIAAENTWTINIATSPPSLVVVKKDLKNVPHNALVGVIYSQPANTGIETYFFEHPQDSAGAIADTVDALLHPVGRPGAEDVAVKQKVSLMHRAISALRISSILVVIALLGALGWKYPFIARRLAIMVPTLAIISVIVFTIIQLPPGDFLSTRIMQLEESGDPTDLKTIDDLRTQFHFEDSALTKYLRWTGLRWFATFNPGDEGLLQANLGRSMDGGQPVNQVMGDRLMLTVLISLGTVLFTWAFAIPVGIYSAVRQYSYSDYALTLIGFVGMCVPAFLLALVLMAMSGVTGLFSPRFAAQPEWNWPKVIDLLKHVWIPVVVLGVGGTAGMIRVMRANLLDELRRPYVVTAMAKGVRPTKLLVKYPVRMSLNPFVSGIGGLFPQLISGGAIVSIVLALPTIGPMMLTALLDQDMNLAGSLLMVLNVLAVLGTLVSDLLLLWLDPRIRFQGGAR